MRGLALSMVLEQRAEESAAAAGHLEAFLRLFAETPYMRPLIRERETCAAVVTEYLESGAESPHRETAQSLLAAMQRVDAVRPPELSEGEKEVLERLGRLQDKQIAAELGLTENGVRYHLRKLFAKLGANTRADALRRGTGTGPAAGRVRMRPGPACAGTRIGGDRGAGRGQAVQALRRRGFRRRGAGRLCLSGGPGGWRGGPAGASGQGLR